MNKKEVIDSWISATSIILAITFLISWMWLLFSGGIKLIIALVIAGIIIASVIIVPIAIAIINTVDYIKGGNKK